MVITNEAKDLFNKILDRGYDAIAFQTINTCHGKRLKIGVANLKEGIQYQTINGLKVVMSDQTASWTKDIVFEANGNKIMMKDPHYVKEDHHCECTDCDHSCTH